jgi:hypothetical protein
VPRADFIQDIVLAFPDDLIPKSTRTATNKTQQKAVADLAMPDFSSD